MDVKEVKSKKLYREYSLVIPFDEINEEINQKITKIIPSVSIPGFRKGKAPISIVRKKYEDSALNEVIQSVINLKISNLIKEKKFNLFRQPKVNLKNFEKNKPIKVELKFDLQPEIKLLDYISLQSDLFPLNYHKFDPKDC